METASSATELRCFFCVLFTLLIVRTDMQKVLRRRRRCNPAVLLLSSQKVVVAVSMADEQAALNGCECNSVFQSLHFFIMSEEPPEDNYILGMVEFSVIRRK